MQLCGWIISFVRVKPKYILLCSSYQLITCSCNAQNILLSTTAGKHWNTKTKIRGKIISTRHFLLKLALCMMKVKNMKIYDSKYISGIYTSFLVV